MILVLIVYGILSWDKCFKNYSKKINVLLMFINRFLSIVAFVFEKEKLSKLA